MFNSTKQWLRRHRSGIAIGAGVIGVGYLAGQYVLGKISEARERMSSERIARENLRRRFEQNQTDCTFTVLALLPTATENILGALPVEELTNELQQKRAERLAKQLNGGEAAGSEISSDPLSTVDDDGKSLSSLRSQGYVHTSQMGDSVAGDGTPRKKSRTQLWNELKVNSLTRSFTLLYTLSLLTLLTRIQLNLLGRRNYLSSVISLASPQADPAIISLEENDGDNAFGNDFETNRRYLTFSWWLLHRGWKDLMEKVEEAVVEVFGPLNPREDITQERLSELTLQVRKKVEGATSEERRVKQWLPYLLPAVEQEDYVLRESGVLLSSEEVSPQTASNLRHLLDETADLIESPQFTHILSLLNNEAFSYLIDHKCAIDAFKKPPSVPATQAPEASPANLFSSSATVVPSDSQQPPPNPRVKLATILAVVSRQAHTIGQGSNPPNEYLSAMEEGVRELEAFAAVVYSSNFGLEGTTSPGGSVGGSFVVVPQSEKPEKVTKIEMRDVEAEAKDEAKDEAVAGADVEEINFESAWGKATTDEK
ncbi:Peroxisomal biogenesis factor [Trichophyton interdigitale]|nr:Microbody (Peroxisome) biogenesis protein peroxin 3 [Trichophyton interdigitale]KAG5217827.1 Microbody (Peroxisome) biogenesis protein peroxin 3 [Trichophyton interdigitale]KAG8206291.1 Peroxisomal biogenesis factor [Trichophyton interdigitale]